MMTYCAYSWKQYSLDFFLAFIKVFIWLILLNNSEWYDDTNWTGKNVERSGHSLISSIILAIAYRDRGKLM